MLIVQGGGECGARLSWGAVWTKRVVVLEVGPSWAGSCAWTGRRGASVDGLARCEVRLWARGRLPMLGSSWRLKQGRRSRNLEWVFQVLGPAHALAILQLQNEL